MHSHPLLRLWALPAVAFVAILAKPPSAHAALYAVTDAGVVFESLNDGGTWTPKGAISEAEVVSMSPGLTPGTLYVLGARGSVYRSSDGGSSWSAVGNIGASDCVAVAVARGGAVLALTQSGDFLRSTDNGATWIPISSVGASDCSSLAVGGKAGLNDTLYVSTSSGDIAMSPTGASWTNVGTTGYTPVVDLLWITKTLYALTDAGETLRSTNSGVSWSAIGTISQVGMRDLAYAGGKFKAISAEGEVYESATGASWPSTWIGTTNQVFTVAFASGVPEFLTGVESPGRGEATLSLRAWPNPFRERVEFRLEGEIPKGDALMDVVDATGRRVRSLAWPQSASLLQWDGRDESGHLVAAGTYFARMASAASVSSHRVVLVR